jgi:Zn-dependent metalloprotease
MTHMIKKMVFTTLFTMSAYFLFAQDDKSPDVLRTRTGNIYFARINPAQTKSLKEAPAFLHDFLKAPQGHEFRLTKEETDKLGNTHQRYAQYYQGIKIEGAEYLVHGKKGLIENTNLQYAGRKQLRQCD